MGATNWYNPNGLIRRSIERVSLSNKSTARADSVGDHPLAKPAKEPFQR